MVPINSHEDIHSNKPDRVLVVDCEWGALGSKPALTSSPAPRILFPEFSSGAIVIVDASWKAYGCHTIMLYGTKGLTFMPGTRFLSGTSRAPTVVEISTLSGPGSIPATESRRSRNGQISQGRWSMRDAIYFAFEWELPVIGTGGPDKPNCAPVRMSRRPRFQLDTMGNVFYLRGISLLHMAVCCIWQHSRGQ